MSSDSDRAELLSVLRDKSLATGEFTLASGMTSTYYIDCRLTTLDARGATLLGRVMLGRIRDEAAARGVAVAAVGGLTLGADPIAVAVAVASYLDPSDAGVLQAFCVRKEPKDHGKGRQVEGNFAAGDTVVVLDDVITTGGSTLRAVEALEREGGIVAFVAVLVDRQEGGRAAIEAAGYPVVAAFTRDELLGA